ncbi:unnamed protein product [Symbiodinium natans]|uniref:Uncharacterized protein n=1 Tax=Symbiodinium natans TaxID=878477 RepID=A0A812V0Z4_9DINO|nr:unnamed protein product [Symbiodinium natans]
MTKQGPFLQTWMMCRAVDAVCCLLFVVRWYSGANQRRRESGPHGSMAQMKKVFRSKMYFSDSRLSLSKLMWLADRRYQYWLSGLTLVDTDIEEEEQCVYTKLTTLTVQNCKASRMEDKEMVLSKIPDIQTFDEQLQYVIFGRRGLLKRRLAGLGLLSAAKRVTLRVAKSADFRFSRELSDSESSLVSDSAGSDEC